MACNQTLSGITTNCGPNKGGIRKVVIRNKSDIDSITLTDGKVTAITKGASAPAAATFEFRKGSSSMSSTLTVSEENGTAYISTEVAMRFAKMETAKRTSMMSLIYAETVALVEDQNGKWWLLGYDNPVTVSAGNGNTGTAMGDANEYGVTLHDESEAYPYEVDATVAEAF